MTTQHSLEFIAGTLITTAGLVLLAASDATDDADETTRLLLVAEALTALPGQLEPSRSTHNRRRRGNGSSLTRAQGADG